MPTYAENMKRLEAKKAELAPLIRQVKAGQRIKHNAVVAMLNKNRSRSRGQVMAKHNPNDINMFGIIGEETAHRFKHLLSMANPTQPLTVRIDSAGGSMLAANSIFDAVKSYAGQTVCIIEANALSAAAYIAQAFDRREITPNGYMMLHNPYFDDDDEPTESDKSLTVKLATNIVDAIVGRCQKSVAQVKAWLGAETWLNADEALAAGLVDDITGQV